MNVDINKNKFCALCSTSFYLIIIREYVKPWSFDSGMNYEQVCK